MQNNNFQTKYKTEYSSLSTPIVNERKNVFIPATTLNNKQPQLNIYSEKSYESKVKKMERKVISNANGQ